MLRLFVVALAMGTCLGWISRNAAAQPATTSGATVKVWHALGSSPCALFHPIETRDHALNVSETILLLRDFHFRCAALPIGAQPPTDWANFQKFLQAAQAAQIDVWAILIPPTEGGDSRPYDTDYLKWFQVLATLSLRYPHLRGVNIDDMLVGFNRKLFTRAYLLQLYQAKQRINPRFLFVPTVYDLDNKTAAYLQGAVDGVWFWWMNLERGLGLASFLENARAVVGKRFPVYAGVYAAPTSWHQEGEPTVRAFMGSMQNACRYSDGVVVWELSLDPNDPLLQITKSYNAGGSEALAGKCGEALDPTAFASPKPRRIPSGTTSWSTPPRAKPARPSVKKETK